MQSTISLKNLLQLKPYKWQRPIDENHAGVIKNGIKSKIFNQKIPTIGTFTIINAKYNGDNILMDGFHRRHALGLLISEGVISDKLTFSAITYDCDTENEVDDRFAEINNTLAMLDLYKNGPDSKLDPAFVKELDAYCMKLKVFKYTNRPYINKTMFLNMVSKSTVFDKFKTVKDFEDYINDVSEKLRNRAVSSVWRRQNLPIRDDGIAMLEKCKKMNCWLGLCRNLDEFFPPK